MKILIKKIFTPFFLSILLFSALSCGGGNVTHPWIPPPLPLLPTRPILPPMLPMSYYKIENGELRTLQYWHSNQPKSNGQPVLSTGYIEQEFPVAASPEHGSIRFSPGQSRQYISLDDGDKVTTLDFQMPPGATFMKPSVDTMLTCLGIKKLIQLHNVRVRRAIDVGAGSGFISKYLAQTSPQSRVTAIDIDPQAGVFMRSLEAGLPQNVEILIEDAITHLSSPIAYDLIVSNPPYVPTLAETQSPNPPPGSTGNFWQGTHLMIYMLEQSLPRLPTDGHLVMVVPSTSLKSLGLIQSLQGLQARGFQARILHQQEVAYKAWFAGNNQVAHLLATPAEWANPTLITPQLNLSVGITPPGHPRNCRIEDGRRTYGGYYWQIVYILDFFRL